MIRDAWHRAYGRYSLLTRWLVIFYLIAWPTEMVLLYILKPWVDLHVDLLLWPLVAIGGYTTFRVKWEDHRRERHDA